MNNTPYNSSPESVGSRICSEEQNPPSTSIAHLFSQEKLSLIEVEKLIASCFDSDADELTTISQYLLDLGGKRVRPLLCLLTAKLFSASTPPKELLTTAAGIELIHMATLLHDDIIDESLVRRNSESAFKKFGQTPTLLTGDFLLVRAFGLCAKLGDLFIVEETENACVRLTEGELIEGHLTNGRNVDFEEYIKIISGKTASLFALATTTGAYFCASDQRDVETMRQFGLELGLLFQMVDDVLDISADKNLLGKPGGVDLKQRVPTLVNILWLNNDPKKASEFFSEDSHSESEIQIVKSHLLESQVFDDCMLKIDQSYKRASNLLEQLVSKEIDLDSKSALIELMDYTIGRIQLTASKSS